MPKPSDIRFDPEPDEDGEYLIGLLPENEEIVDVYLRCEWTLALGMSAHWVGISTQEALATCIALSVPRKRWPSILDGLRVMTRAASPIKNKAKDT